MKNIVIKTVIVSLITLLSIFTISNTIYANSDSNSSIILKLSDDIWKMADRIWEMADKILIMADKIIETQKIQSKNLETTQNNILKTLEIMEKWIELNNKLLQSLIDSNK